MQRSSYSATAESENSSCRRPICSGLSSARAAQSKRSCSGTIDRTLTSSPISLDCSKSFMPEIENQPVLTETYPEAASFRPFPGSVYIFGQSPEERSGHVNSWKAMASGVQLRCITKYDAAAFEVGNSGDPISLRSE